MRDLRMRACCVGVTNATPNDGRRLRSRAHDCSNFFVLTLARSLARSLVCATPRQLLEQQAHRRKGWRRCADQHRLPGRERHLHGKVHHLRHQRGCEVEGKFSIATNAHRLSAWRRKTPVRARVSLTIRRVDPLQGESDSALDHLWQKKKSELGE